MMDMETVLLIPMVIMAWAGALAISIGLLLLTIGFVKEVSKGIEWFRYIRRTALQRDYLAKELSVHTKKSEVFWLRKARELA